MDGYYEKSMYSNQHDISNPPLPPGMVAIP